MDRFDVAFLMEGIAAAEELQGTRLIDDGARYEKLADTLQAELGSTPEVLGLYVSLVRTTDTASSVRVAGKLLAQKDTPSWVREQVQPSVDRSKLIGKPLELKLTTIGGNTVDLAQPSDRPTVVYYWHASSAQRDLEVMDHFKRSSGANARWLAVGMGCEAPRGDGSMAGSPFADVHCYEAAQKGNPAIAYLKVQQAPYAFVLDAAGRLVGYGSPEAIPSLLHAASR